MTDEVANNTFAEGGRDRDIPVEDDEEAGGHCLFVWISGRDRFDGNVNGSILL